MYQKLHNPKSKQCVQNFFLYNLFSWCLLGFSKGWFYSLIQTLSRQSKQIDNKLKAIKSSDQIVELDNAMEIKGQMLQDLLVLEVDGLLWSVVATVDLEQLPPNAKHIPRLDYIGHLLFASYQDDIAELR